MYQRLKLKLHDSVLNIRISKFEHQKLIEKATEKGISKSEYVREKLGIINYKKESKMKLDAILKGINKN